MNAVEVRPAPFEWLETDPEDRKYWTSGAFSRPNVFVVSKSNSLVVFSSEESAMAFQRRLAANHPGAHTFRRPSPITRGQATEIARSMKMTTVRVRDESGQIVEEWPVT